MAGTGLQWRSQNMLQNQHFWVQLMFVCEFGASRQVGAVSAVGRACCEDGTHFEPSEIWRHLNSSRADSSFTWVLFPSCSHVPSSFSQPLQILQTQARHPLRWRQMRQPRLQKSCPHWLEVRHRHHAIKSNSSAWVCSKWFTLIGLNKWMKLKISQLLAHCLRKK